MHSSLILTASFITGAFATFNGYPPQGLVARKSLKARQDPVDISDVSPNAEHCGTDTEGFDWWCEDPSTTCCFGSQLWQCIPRTAEECCTTGFYCPSGSHCFLGVDTVQYCLVPEEEEEQASHPNDFKPSQTAVQAEAAQTGAADTTEEDSGSSSGGKSSGGKSSGGKSSGGKKGGKSSSLKSSGIKLNAPAAAFFGLAVAAFW